MSFKEYVIPKGIPFIFFVYFSINMSSRWDYELQIPLGMKYL